MPELRIRVGPEQFAFTWLELGLEHRCLLCLQRHWLAHSATDIPTQYQSNVWRTFGPKLIERVQVKSLKNLLRDQSKDLGSHHRRSSNSRRRDRRQHERAPTLRLGPDA